MRNSAKKTALCLITAFILMFTGLVPAFAEDEKTAAQNVCSVLQNDLTQLICVSKYGDTVNYPENSVEGVVSAAEAGADMVLVSVKKTSDGTIVLMADDSLSRMCVDQSGNSVDKDISQVGFYELATYHLRNSTGLLHEKITAYTVPTLKETVEKLGGRAMLLIGGGWEFKDDIYSLLTEMNALNSAVIIADGKKKDVSQWMLGKSSKPLVFSEYQGNVVWNSGSYIKKTVSAGVAGVILGDNNSHSTSFSASTVEKLGGKARAVIDMTSPEMCGKRQDAPLGWDEVTSRGFSVIITNNVGQFCEYRQRVNTARERLNALVERTASIDTTLLSTVSANNLNGTLSKVKGVADTSVSAMTLEGSYCELQNAVYALTDRTAEDNKGMTVTKGRIAAAVLVIIGLIVLEIVFEYYRKKKIAARKLGRKKKKVRKNNDIDF